MATKTCCGDDVKQTKPSTTTAGFPRAELEEMVQRWIEANREAERRGDWSALAHQFYTEDAVYQWNMGPNQEFAATGRQEIADVALGYHMKGFEDWRYPYQEPAVIDERNGVVVCFWEQIGPGVRATDGTPYRVEGTGGSRFAYAGNFQWSWQRDFFDLGNTRALLLEMAGARQLNGAIRQKIADQARGKLLPGTHRLRPEPGVCAKIKNFVAMTRIAFFG